jgi:hypothetical protein
MKVGGASFFKTSNGGYGENWVSGDGENPVVKGSVPDYKDIVSEIRLFIGWKGSRTQNFPKDIQTQSSPRDEGERGIGHRNLSKN